jgi:VCBS repeat-containing protein
MAEIITGGEEAGKVRYTPGDNYTGADSFEYTVCDNGTPSKCATATVDVNVTAVNDAPVAGNDSYETEQNKTLKVPAPGVLKNDKDGDNGNEDLSSKVDQGPKKGELTLNKNGSFTYKPNFGFNGKDSFVYRISDGEGDTDTATVTVTVRDTTAPTVVRLSVTGNSARPNFAVTFSEAMDPTSLNKNTFALIKKGTTKSVAATVRYDAASKKAVLEPSSKPRPGTTYVLTVKGGSRGVKDLAGNALAKDKVWTFRW